MWNGDRASDGLVHSIPENLSVFILALGISLEILHTYTQKAIAHLSNMNLLYRFEPYLPIFVSPPLSFSSFLPLLSSFEIQVESHYSKNFTLSPSSSSSFFLLARNDIKYRKIIRHEDFIASRRIMDTKGLMAIDIHVQYRKIIKSVEIVESILRSLVSFYSRISSPFLYTSEFVFCTCSHDSPLLFRINIA